MNGEVDNFKGKCVNISKSILKVEIENYLAMIDGFSKDNADERIKTAIFTSYPRPAFSGDFKSKPKLVTLIKKNRKDYYHNDKIFEWFKILIRTKSIMIKGFHPREYSEQLVDDLYNHSKYNHIAFIDKVYYIKKDYTGQIDLWKELCSNGIFDQWKWCAPFNRYSPITKLPNKEPLANYNCHLVHNSKELFEEYFENDPIILLLRVYKISEIFSVANNIKNSRNSCINPETYCSKIHITDPVIPDDDFIKIRDKLEDTLTKFDMLKNSERIHYKSCFL